LVFYQHLQLLIWLHQVAQIFRLGPLPTECCSFITILQYLSPAESNASRTGLILDVQFNHNKNT